MLVNSGWEGTSGDPTDATLGGVGVETTALGLGEEEEGEASPLGEVVEGESAREMDPDLVSSEGMEEISWICERRGRERKKVSFDASRFVHVRR